jgi:hypothetical protein
VLRIYDWFKTKNSKKNANTKKRIWTKRRIHR